MRTLQRMKPGTLSALATAFGLGVTIGVVSNKKQPDSTRPQRPADDVSHWENPPGNASAGSAAQKNLQQNHLLLLSRINFEKLYD
jgi:hypothetical protein